MTLPAWVPAPEQKPAPEPLLLVQAFVNTRDLDLGTDLLADPAQANRWLHHSGLLAPEHRAGPGELRAARDVREGIRALLARNSGGPPPTCGPWKRRRARPGCGWPSPRKAASRLIPSRPAVSPRGWRACC